MDELRARINELEQRFAGEIAELRAQLVAPAAPQASGQLAELVAELQGSAPAELQQELSSTLTALRESGNPREQAQLVVELVELCEESRRTGDFSHAFYEDLEGRLERLTSSLQLEVIRPSAGQAYKQQEHMILRSVRGGGPRDTIERCLKRGFRWQGQLLKKAEVSVYL